MIIKLFDGQEIVCSRDEAGEVVKAIEEKVDMVHIKGMFIKTSAVSKVVPGGYTEPDRSNQLPPPPTETVSGSLKKRLRSKNPKLFNKLYGP